MAYFGITAGISLGTGLILGLIYKIKRTESDDCMDVKWFSDDFGLYSSEMATQTYIPASSAGNLNEVPTQSKL